MDKSTVYGILIVAVSIFIVTFTILNDDDVQVRELAPCNLEPRLPPPDVPGISWNLDECYYFLDDPSIEYNFQDITLTGHNYNNSDLENIPCKKIIQVFEAKDWSQTRSGDLANRYNDCFFEDDFEIDFEDDFEETWNDLVNEQPGIYVWETLDICTLDMINHLSQYSNILTNEENVSLDWIGLPDGMNIDDFEQCYEELLEIRNEKLIRN